MRLIEIVLFCLPLAVFLACWRFGRFAPSPALLGASLVALTILGGALVWFGVERRIGPDERYIPARLVDGQIVEGHAGGALPRPRR